MREAMLYEKLDAKKVRCRLCNHYCLIPDGKLGYCAVRLNEDGKLYSLSYGKSTGFAVDPIEKKPFFHFKPGTRSLSFGTPGCNFRCVGCFTPETPIATSKGTKQIREIFESGVNEIAGVNGEVRDVIGLKAVSHTGRLLEVKKVSRHIHAGQIIALKPAFAPEIKCTDYHQVFVWENGALTKKKAGDIREGEVVVIPKPKLIGEKQVIDVLKLFESHKLKSSKARRKTLPILTELLQAREKGFSSKQIGKKFGLHPTYVRRFFLKIRKYGLAHAESMVVEAREENGFVRFVFEKSKGIPRFIELDEGLATLLGFYCAEGFVHKFKNRRNTFKLTFCFGVSDSKLVDETTFLLKKVFNADCAVMKRRNVTKVSVRGTSIALFFKKLCGSGARQKRVPSILFTSSNEVIKAFLQAYNKGNGWSKEGKHPISMDSVSRELALGVWWLLLHLGALPSFFVWHPSEKTEIEGRTVNQSMLHCVKVYSKRHAGVVQEQIQKQYSRYGEHFKETENYFLVPVREMRKENYVGNVYNLEVEEDHSYLAGFIAVGNCQNWFMSQSPRESERALDFPETPPAEIARACVREEADGVSYTYSEPTIFFEYAYDTIKETRKLDARKYHNFVTNGFFSRECFEVIKREKLLEAIRIDLKAMNDDFYKKYCGAPSMKPVLENIKRVFESGIHLEVIALVIPSLNDSDEELRELSRFVASVSKDIPLHFLRFIPQYKASDLPLTPEKTLLRAREIARSEGLRFVYVGNAAVPGGEDTLCPKCGTLLVSRDFFSVVENKLSETRGKCPNCGQCIYGVW